MSIHELKNNVEQIYIFCFFKSHINILSWSLKLIPTSSLCFLLLPFHLLLPLLLWPHLPSSATISFPITLYPSLSSSLIRSQFLSHCLSSLQYLELKLFSFFSLLIHISYSPLIHYYLFHSLFFLYDSFFPTLYLSLPFLFYGLSLYI